MYAFSCTTTIFYFDSDDPERMKEGVVAHRDS